MSITRFLFATTATFFLVTLYGACGDNAMTAAQPDAPLPCSDGFTIEEGICVDIDECAVATSCGTKATCVNTDGAFNCLCPTGWTSVGNACALPVCKYQYDEGHGDMYATMVGDEIQMGVRSAFNGAGPEQLYPATEVCINVPRLGFDEIVSFGGRPAASSWDPIGVAAGEGFWYLPEQALTGMPWFGIASEVSALGGIPIADFGPTLTITIDVDGPEGGSLSAWGAVQDELTPPPFIFSTTTGLLQAEVITSSHAHYNWGFSKAGEYVVETRIAGTRTSTGQRVTSAPVFYRFIVM